MTFTHTAAPFASPSPRRSYPDRSDGDTAGDNDVGQPAGLQIVRSAWALALCGVVDLGTDQQLADVCIEFALRCAADDARLSHLDGVPTRRTATLDVAELEFIGAGGLGILVALQGELARSGIGMRVINASAQLRRVCRICELDHVLGIETAGSGRHQRPRAGDRRS